MATVQENVSFLSSPPSPLTILSMCILVLRYSYLLPITNFHRIKFKIYFGEEDGIPGFSRKFKRFDWMKKVYTYTSEYTLLFSATIQTFFSFKINYFFNNYLIEII